MNRSFATIPARAAAHPRPTCQEGVSLVELMIAMAIGLVILAAMSMVFINSQSARGQIEKSSRLTENGRYSLYVLAEDLSLAGYYGEASITVASPATPGATASPNDYICVADKAILTNLIPIHVYGIHNVTTAGKPSCIPEAIKPGTDVLVVRRVTTTTTAVGAAAAGTFYFQASLCTSDSPTYVLSDTAADWTLKQRNCTAAAVLRQALTRIYYVAANNASGDGIPTLKRAEMVGNTWTTPEVLAIADGVEDFQVQYGIDSAGSDGVPDAYTSAPATSTAADMQTWRNAMTAKVALLIRSADKTPGYSDSALTYTVGPNSVAGAGDGYKRHVFESTIEMKNALGRREL